MELDPSKASLEIRLRGMMLRNLSPSEVLRLIRETPVFNTVSPKEWANLRETDLGADPDHPGMSISRFKGTRYILGWVYAGGSDQIVGLQWDEQGVSRMYYAIMLPPE